ncbi:hypothetical protein GCM10018966_022590 [Streptomyces yanii]
MAGLRRVVEHRTVRPIATRRTPSAQADAANLPARLDTCLAQATAPALPLNPRAARALLDVCFFHPFEDGNALRVPDVDLPAGPRGHRPRPGRPRSACAPQGG